MGFRTVVMLNNDRAHEWSKDKNLGACIMQDMNRINTGTDRLSTALYPYGRVVECTHADEMTLAVLGGYDIFNPQSHSFYHNSGVGLQQEVKEAALKLVKCAAEELGYRLVKKSK